MIYTADGASHLTFIVINFYKNRSVYYFVSSISVLEIKDITISLFL